MTHCCSCIIGAKRLPNLTYTVLTAARVYSASVGDLFAFVPFPGSSLISDLLCGAEGHRGYNTVSWVFFFFISFFFFFFFFFFSSPAGVLRPCSSGSSKLEEFPCEWLCVRYVSLPCRKQESGTESKQKVYVLCKYIAFSFE